MPVSDTKPEYNKFLPRWCMTRDSVEGSAEVKKGTTKYLPKPNPEDNSSENDQRYLDYIERANFVGFTSSTLDGMVGMVFRKPLEVEIQQSIEYLQNNVNGGGLTLDQLARSIVGELLQTARQGLLVDYPRADEGLTKAQVQALGLTANILDYNAESVLNWQTTMVGSVKMLSLVVLAEKSQELSDDGFSYIEKDQYRVLRLLDGVYVQEIWNDKNEIQDAFEPRKADGSKWSEIPFIFAGARNNDECIDKAPLYDIATINIAHYRNSADYEESCYMVGQPTPFISGLTQGWVDENMKNGVMLGSRRAMLLPDGGNAGLLQANPNQMPEKGMELKEQQMIKIGARIIQDSAGQETAEAAKIRFAGQNSKLGVIVGNTEAALLQCFEWCMWFMGGDGENLIEINKDFYERSAEPQMVMASIQLLDRGVIAKSDLQDDLRSKGVIKQERTNEDIDDEAEQIQIGIF